MYPGFRAIGSPNYSYQQNQRSGQLHNVANLGFLTNEGYPIHQNQYHGYGVTQNSMRDYRFFHQPGFMYHSFQQQAQAYQASQLAAQAQVPQVNVEAGRKAEKLVKIKPEPPMSKTRLIWTPELHERFMRATMELGGPCEAKPKAIMQKMNMKGLTVVHLKSHLQKVRMRYHKDKAARKNMDPGIQTSGCSYAPQSSPGEASSSTKPTLGSDITQHGRMLRSSETPNCNNDLGTAASEDLANYFNFEAFGRH